MRMLDLVVGVVLTTIITTARVCHSFTLFPLSKTRRHFSSSSSLLYVSIGLGPEDSSDSSSSTTSAGATSTTATTTTELVEYEIPNHEEYRQSRRSKMDEQVDEWFGALLLDVPPNHHGCLGHVAQKAKQRLLTPVPLVNELESLPRINNPEWTPFVSTKLPWTPLVPAYGLEQFGLPTPRRDSEAWRFFDVSGMIAYNYVATASSSLPLSQHEVDSIQARLQEQGVWLNNDKCVGRLVYVNGHYCAPLSKTTNDITNLDALPSDPILQHYLSRLTDGFTDELAVPVSNGGELQTSYQKLSYPNHKVGSPISQFAINTQQGTACFAALNTVQTQHVALVTSSLDNSNNNRTTSTQPVLIINAVTPSGGGMDDDDGNDNTKGVAMHPRTLIVAGEHSTLHVVQATVDLGAEATESSSSSLAHRPKLYNGYTQVFVHAHANVTHSYLEESGGMPTSGVELDDSARELETQRPELRDTHLETLDVHIMGEHAGYKGTVMCLGGSGRVRVALSAALLAPNSEAIVKGFALSGGVQRIDMKTNIHHIAQGTTSRQTQKNMIGGRATGAFRGRIRVEQSAQQTDSQQLSRTVLLSDKARAWAVPSLEIIADDVKCSHGSTVSDLSEEELFYLRTRGLSRSRARNLLMYAFAGDITTAVDPAMLGSVDSEHGLQKRVIRRLENLVPQGERAIKGEFQSI